MEDVTPVETTGDPADFTAEAAQVSTSPQEATVNETTAFVAVLAVVTPVGTTGGRAESTAEAALVSTSPQEATVDETTLSVAVLTVVTPVGTTGGRAELGGIAQEVTERVEGHRPGIEHASRSLHPLPTLDATLTMAAVWFNIGWPDRARTFSTVKS